MSVNPEQLYRLTLHGTYEPVPVDYKQDLADLANTAALGQIAASLRRAWQESAPEDKREFARAVLHHVSCHLEHYRYALDSVAAEMFKTTDLAAELGSDGEIRAALRTAIVNELKDVHWHERETVRKAIAVAAQRELAGVSHEQALEALGKQEELTT